MDDDDDSEDGSRPGENGDVDMDDIPTQVTAKIPAQESAKMPAKETLTPPTLEDAMRNAHGQLSAQQQLAAQQLNVHQFGSRQQLTAQQLAATSGQQSALQQLNAQQQSALQQLNAQQQHALQQHLGVQHQLGAQQMTPQQQIALQQQLGAQKQQPQHLNPEAMAMSLQDRHGLASLSAQATIGGMQMGSLLGQAGSGLGAVSQAKGEGSEMALQSPLAKTDMTFSLPSKERRDKLLSERKDKWLQLLANRPYTTDGNTMSAWLMEILTVSDLTMSTGEATDSPTKEQPKSSKPANDDKADENAADDDDEEEEEDADEEDQGEEEEEEEDDEDENEAATADDEEEEDEENEDDAAANGGKKETGASEGGNEKDSGVGKKRPQPEASPAKGSKQGSDAGYSGSFAEWRDRKKQKKGLTNKNPSP